MQDGAENHVGQALFGRTPNVTFRLCQANGAWVWATGGEYEVPPWQDVDHLWRSSDSGNLEVLSGGLTAAGGTTLTAGLSTFFAPHCPSLCAVGTGRRSSGTVSGVHDVVRMGHHPVEAL